MRCTEVQNLLNGEPQPGSIQLPEVEAHLEQCSACRAARQHLVSLRAVLRSLPPPALPDGFELELRRRLKSERGTRGRKASRWAMSQREKVMALAASFLLVVSGVVMWRALGPGGKAGSVSYHRLHLAVQTVQPQQGALFDIDLPNGVELAPEAGAALRQGNTLRWSSDLAPGKNAIDLPLVVRGVPAGPIQATLTVNGRTFRSNVALQSGHARTARRDGVDVVEVAWLLDDRSTERKVVQ